MGWTFKSGYNRRDLIADRARDPEWTTAEGVVGTVCLAHCYRQAVFWGVLWSVWERSFTKGGE